MLAANLEFLESSGFRSESVFESYWISLDFLGFSRPNRAFSMGYEAIRLENSFLTVFARGRRAKAAAPPARLFSVRAFPEHSISRAFHRRSLTSFLIFSNILRQYPGIDAPARMGR
jgi:hypothetical protein